MRPSTLVPDLGQKCYREPGEPRDGRPLLKIPQFWDSAEEAEAYLTAVREHPRIVDLEAGTVESSLTYIARIASIVAERRLANPAKRIPPKPRLNREYDGPRLTTEGNLSFEDRTDAIYERQPGEDDE